MALNQVGLERLGTQVSKKIGASKNLIINGAFQVAQRGTSSTSTGYQTVDRVTVLTNGVDEQPTQAQVDVASGTEPYTNGFRKAFKLTNGNQTSGAGAADFIVVRHKIESQNVANSGWDYTSTSSNITLSFWIKASVAQNYFFSVLSSDGTLQNFPMETGSLSADTWTKITKIIPGASNVQFDNDNGIGIELDWWPFAGTSYTASGVALNTWAAFASGTRFPDHTSTWYTTNDATLEITGVQLEVGSVATDFEHRSFGQELALCQRYYQIVRASLRNDYRTDLVATFGNGAQTYCEMRTSPTASTVTSVATQDISSVGYGYISKRGFMITGNGIATIGGTAAQQAVRDVGLAAEL